jgi:hypothetical protein
VSWARIAHASDILRALNLRIQSHWAHLVTQGEVGGNELLQTDVKLGGVVHSVYSSAQLLREGEQIRRMQWSGAIASRDKYHVAAGEGLHEQVGAGFASGVNERVQREIKR